MKKIKLLLTLACSAPLSQHAIAQEARAVVQPLQTENATIRFDQGASVVDQQRAHGWVQVSPYEMDHGSVVLQVSVYNDTDVPVNVDITNFSAQTPAQALPVLSKEQLVAKAKNRAMWSQLGVALLAGAAAGVAASQQDTYTSRLYTPRGTYVHTYTAPSVAGQVAAAASVAGGAVAVTRIQDQLDETRRRLNADIVQISTVPPRSGYSGVIVLTKIKDPKMPQVVDLNVDWNGERYPFRFQVVKRGTPQPAWTALTGAPSQSTPPSTPTPASMPLAGAVAIPTT